jgi:tRNA G46 methylase TrmB
MVDVGGSHGEVVSAIASKFPNLNYIVQDLPNTIATVPKLNDSLPF